jgi:amidase
MNRRSFLRLAAYASSAAIALPAVAGANRKMPAPQRIRVRSFALDEVTIDELRRRMAAGKASSVDLVKRYVARIKEIDRSGPALNSVIETNPDAFRIAEELDRERKSKGPRGPLHGIPVLLKDNIDTHDRMWTTAGSLALAGSIPPRDAFLVEKLRSAGAVILGKTNLSEWANFRDSASISGWSARGGQTKNAYVLDRNPSGSSSGSAVAVAANLCAVAVGTETDGSIVSPASYNGIVGIKPTLGLISRAGIIPIAQSQDTAGPMARTVKDAAILLSSLTGTDPRDPATAESSAKAQPDYAQDLAADGLKGARIGIARTLFGFHPEVDAIMEKVILLLTREGALIVDPIDFKKSPELDGAEIEVLRFEFKAGLNAYLAGLGSNAPVRTLQDIIEFNEQHRDIELRWFGQRQFIRSQEKGPLSDPAYQAALAKSKRLTREEGIDAVVDKHSLDAILAPTNNPAHVTDLVLGDHWLGGSSTYAAVAGYPSITVPAGHVSGLPIGLSFFGGAWSEQKLVRIAYAFEQATHARRPPCFWPTLTAAAPTV